MMMSGLRVWTEFPRVLTDITWTVRPRGGGEGARGRGGEVARGLMFNEAAADWEIGCRPPRLLMSPPPPPPTHPHCALGGG